MAAEKSTGNELQNVAQKLSDLVQAYINAGTQVASGLTKVVADTVEDLSETYCGQTGSEKKDSEGHIGDATGVCSRMVERTTDQVNTVCEPFAEVCKADSLSEATDEATEAAQKVEKAQKAEKSK